MMDIRSQDRTEKAESIPASGALRSSLLSGMAGKATRLEIARVVEESHHIALAYLRVATYGVRYMLRKSGVNIEDLAYDAIADLFAQGDTGSLPVLAQWWNSLPSSERADADKSFLAFRRLVIGAVHQRVFQMYRDVDPHLAKIIRNIKIALKRHPSVERGNEGGAMLLIPRSCRSLRLHLPPMPHELLLPELFDAIRLRSSLKEMLGVLGRVLRAQTDYRRTVTIVEAAALIREVYLSDAQYTTVADRPEGLSEDEIRAMVAKTLDGVLETILANYRRRGAVSPPESDAHASALSDILRITYLDGSGRDGSYFDALKRHLPSLTKGTYREKHRVILEYLVKSATKDIRRRLRAEQK